MNPSGSPVFPSPGGPDAPKPSHSRERRALWVGLTSSIFLHILALIAYTVAMDQITASDPSVELRDPDPPHMGTEIVVVLELPDAELPPSPEEVPVDPEPDAPELEVVVPEDLPDSPVEDEEGLSLAERLQPQMTDPRLWAPVDPHHTELTDQERADLLLRGMIQSWNDSVAVAAALSEGARDWSYTDDDGRRWGLSPGRIHLGDFSIPLPFSFTVPPGRWMEARERAWILDDLNRGAASAEMRETWADRARVIRERMESERSPGSQGGSSGDDP